MGGGNDAPEADPRIGKAALMSAKLGKNYLSWAKERSKTTDAWAREDRARAQGTFQPLQDSYIAKAKTWDSRGRQMAAARGAVADVQQQSRIAQATQSRDLASMGVNPNSRRFAALKRSTALSSGLAAAGAGNLARRQVRSEGDAMRANAINMGSGLAVNPLSSMTAGSSTVAGGFSGAMQGQQQAGNLYNQQYQQQMASWEANQQGSGIAGSLGAVAGMMVNPTSLATMMPFLSDEKAKTKRKKAGRSLPALKALAVDAWEYKPDAAGGDGGGTPHVGPMAQDFQKATGLGDGRTIHPADAIGVTMKAVKELDAKVSRIARGLKQPARSAA